MDDSLTLVDENDNIVSSISKFDAHYKIDGKKPEHPHRAFSLFLFNQNNELLMQQRSEKKITSLTCGRTQSAAIHVTLLMR